MNLILYALRLRQRPTGRIKKEKLSWLGDGWVAQNLQKILYQSLDQCMENRKGNDKCKVVLRLAYFFF